MTFRINIDSHQKKQRFIVTFFNSSNSVVCSHLILTYTVQLAIVNATELKPYAVFVTFIEECCVVIGKNFDKKLANRISNQIWYKLCLKGKFGRWVQICEGRELHIRQRIWTGGVQIHWRIRSGGSNSVEGPNPLLHWNLSSSLDRTTQIQKEIFTVTL